MIRPSEYLRMGLPIHFGRSWYGDATATARRIADDYGVRADAVAEVLAITSPRVHVKRNVALTLRYLETRTHDIPGMLPGVKAALLHWELTEEIRGPKTRAFADAIQGDTSAVVVDVWMARAFGLKRAPTAADHRRIAQSVRAIATRNGMSPRSAQAAIWQGCRIAHGFKGGAFMGDCYNARS